MKIICAGYLIRYPIGGQVLHHLQYLIGLKRLGYHVTYVEHYSMPNFCYDPLRDSWTHDPSYGIAYLLDLFRLYDLDERWCYIAEGEACYGMNRSKLATAFRECDLFLNLSNINWIPEIELCPRRILVDTDPVFTQIGAHGLGGPFSNYHACFTYGENIHQPGCEMPTSGHTWLPTRQPIALDIWRIEASNPSAPFTTVMNWTAFGDSVDQGRTYGQKDRQFEPFFTLPVESGQPMELAVSVPSQIRTRMEAGGWVIRDPRQVTDSPASYQEFVRNSKAEFSVAKHAYVSTGCGWFSDRSAAYLASGRPVVVEDTGFSRWLETGLGALTFQSHQEALKGISEVNDHYSAHSRAAREIAEMYFDSNKVLTSLIDRGMNATTPVADRGAS